MERPFEKYRRNVYSQNGEDGVLDHLLMQLELRHKPGTVVEFGAWDGKHFSNTFNLVRQSDQFRAIYIEGDREKFPDLRKTANAFTHIVPVLAVVEPENFTDLLLSNHCDRHPDVLSIDIDGYDYQVWQGLSDKLFAPKIVVIEINSSYGPYDLRWHAPPVTQGSSFAAMLALGQSKGYELVCHTGNMIFVRRELVKKLDIPDDFISCPQLLWCHD